MLKRRIARTAAPTAMLLVALAGLNPAQADVPPALDRVPENAAVVIMIRNMDQVTTRITALTESLKVPMDEDPENPLVVAKMLLQTKGLNKTGSLALAVMPGPDGTLEEETEGEEGPVLLFAPITNFNDFVTSLGATSTEGVVDLVIDGKPNFAKDIGGGFAVIGPHREMVADFTSKGGHKQTHMTALGKNGQQIADTADVLFFANIAALKPQLEQAATGMKEQGDMMAMMAGPGGEGVATGMKAMQGVMDSVLADGQVGVMGLGITEKGLWFDMGAQFREGTPSATFFSGAGKSSALLSKIPNMPFLFAGAIDVSAPGIKQLVKNAGELRTADAGEAGGAGALDSLIKLIDSINGYSFTIGANPAGMMGGLFANTTTFVSTKDPKAYLAAQRENTKALDGKAEQGVTMKVAYTTEGSEVSGVKVDTWSVQPQFDPNDPNAMQAQMMIGMLFGQGGIGGMAAPVENGVVMTMSQNTPLMTSALEVAKGGKGLSEDALLKETQVNLPANRTFELYLGTKSILDTVVGVMAMMGQGPELNIPAQISPIAVSGTTDGGGVTLRVYLPNDVMKTFADMAQSMDQGAEDDMDAPADEDGAAPRF